MKEVKRAIFDFETYRVLKFSLENIQESSSNSYTIALTPTGVFYPSQNRFVIDFDFKAIVGEENEPQTEIVSALLQASFVFSESIELDEIPSYFYRNSLGLIFPYLRAFISTLTFQANMPPIILPIVNLVELEAPFRESIVVAE